MIFIHLYIFLVGITLGSFYNVVGLRVPVKKSIVTPRSACPSCHHTLTAWELIPVFSYLMQRGKCRSCQTRIPIIYPIIELSTGILFVSAPLLVGWTSELFIVWTLISLMIIIFVSDITYMLIPDKILLVFTGIFFIERLFIPLSPWWDSLTGAATGFGLLLLIAIISKGGMGGGDIKLFALIGFIVGMKTVLLSIFFSALLGALFGGIALTLGWVKRKQPIPFGPFIVLGTFIAYIYGETILEWYMNFLINGF